MKELYVKGDPEFIKELFEKARDELGNKIEIIDINPQFAEP